MAWHKNFTYRKLVLEVDFNIVLNLKGEEIKSRETAEIVIRACSKHLLDSMITDQSPAEHCDVY